MKKIFLTIILIWTISNISNAQGLRLNTYASYVFQDHVDSYYDPYNYYEGQINDGFQWGLGLEVLANPNSSVELLYFRRDTYVPLTYLSSTNYFPKYSNFKTNINYIMLGGNRSMRKSGSKIETTGGLMLGVVWANLSDPETGRESSTTKFAWGLKGGVNIWATEKIGIKLNAQMLSAVQSVGGSFYFGSGGSGAGLSTYSTIYQFSLGGGLVFNLGK